MPGFSEILLIALLFLLIFGPDKVPKMAREVGRFANEARNAMDEFKNELTLSDEDESEEKPPQSFSTEKREKQSLPDDSEDEGEYDL